MYVYCTVPESDCAFELSKQIKSLNGGCVRRCRGALREMVQLLVRRGANANQSSVPLPPLLLAVRSGDVDIVRMLLQAGADPRITLPQSVRRADGRCQEILRCEIYLHVCVVVE